MRPPLLIVLVVTLATNLTLGTLIWRRLSATPNANDSTVARASADAIAPASRPVQRAAPETRAGSASQAKPAAASPAWEKLSAGGPGQLVANLRAAGFRPQLIHAIVEAMVTESFALRRYTLEFGEPDTPYWRQPQVFFDHPARIQALAKLGEEQDRQMRALLGDDYKLQDVMMAADMKRRFGNLSPEKLAQVEALVADFRLQLTVVRPTAGQPFPPPSTELPLELSAEKRQQLAGLLTPEELREFDLRNGSAGLALRALPGFNATEAEYRALHEILAAANVGPPNGLSRQPDVPAVQAALSPDRYLDYKQATAPGQATLNRLVERLGQPISAARQVASIRAEATAQMAAVRADTTLSAPQRTERLNAIVTAGTERIGSVLGPRGLEALRVVGGGWPPTAPGFTPTR